MKSQVLTEREKFEAREQARIRERDRFFQRSKEAVEEGKQTTLENET